MKTKEELNALKRGNTKMEKITKEELLNKLGAHALSDEELETVAGGETECLTSCVNKAHGDLDGRALQACQLSCLK